MDGEGVSFHRLHRPMLLALASICLLALVGSMASAERYWDDVAVEEVGSWTVPGGEGEDFRFDVSPDGTRIVLASEGGVNDVVVTDRAMNVLATMDLPEEGADIEGVRWSQTGRWIYAWGPNGSKETDNLWMWDSDTYEPTEGMFENHTTPLNRLDSVLFVAGDEILALAGRDVNGTARVLLWETAWSTVRRDIPWEDNATVSHLGTDMMQIVCIDERGDVTTIGGIDWETVTDLGGHEATPTATSTSVYIRHPWIVGYEDGWALFWGGHPSRLENASQFDEEPVQAISWASMDGGGYYLLAVPEEGTGTRLIACFHSNDGPPDIRVAEPLVFPHPMTRMVYDVMAPGQVWCAFDDGTIILLNVTTIPDLQPEVSIDVPEFQKRYDGDFLASGTYHDDHDRIEYIRVRIDTGTWYEAEFSGGEWSFMVNMSQYGQGERIFNVVAYDGRTQTFNQTFFHFPLDDEGGDDGEWPPGIPAIPFTIIAVAVLLYLAWRWKKGEKGR